MKQLILQWWQLFLNNKTPETTKKLAMTLQCFITFAKKENLT